MKLAQGAINFRVARAPAPRGVTDTTHAQNKHNTRTIKALKWPTSEIAKFSFVCFLASSTLLHEVMVVLHLQCGGDDVVSLLQHLRSFVQNCLVVGTRLWEGRKIEEGRERERTVTVI